MAEGGQVEQFCSEKRAHGKECEYFDDGGAVGSTEALLGSSPEADAKEAQYGGIGNEVLAAGEGLANTVTGGLYHVAAKKADEALGLDPTFHEKVREQNPVAYGAGQLGGLLSGEGAVGAASKLTEGMSLAPKLGLENALFTLGDEVSRSVNQSPDSIQTALMHVGLSGILGAGAGRVLGKASDLWTSTVGKEAENFTQGFVKKIQDHVNPKTEMTFEELQNLNSEPPKAPSAGEKAADFVIKKSNNLASEALADGLGAAMGRMSGIPMGGRMGAMFGHYALKPLISTALPALIKPLLKMEASGVGLKAAFDAINAVAKGETMLNTAAKSIFESGSSKLDLMPDKDKLSKLDDQLKTLQERPEALMGVGGDIGHYMPAHQTALAMTAQAAANYLNAQRPRPVQPGMLNRPIDPSQDQLAAYNRTLAIAQQPLMVLKHLQDGTLKPKDVQDLRTLYPAIAPKLIQKLNNHMIDHISKDKIVPFKIRRGMSMLMGQPMDSTFSQSAIAAAQATFMPLIPPQMPQGKSSSKSSTAKLGKSVEMAQTPNEARIKALSKA